MDDIPEALREKSNSKSASSQLPVLILSTMGGLLAVGGVFWLLGSWLRPQPSLVTSSPATPEVTPVITPTPLATSPAVENVLGHLPYEEASISQLKAVTPDGQIRLRQAAADKFLQMQAQARASGVILAPISGFRSISEQNYLFFQVKQERNQETRKRAEVSAPPGYSEHHTGYAIDIGDARSPATNLSSNFANTAAFRWLKNNAAKYSFEMSFPENNPQGVNYEPWHWRYVGDQKSLETFYQAKNLLQKGTGNREQGTGNRE